jgi:hypothetical protein
MIEDTYTSPIVAPILELMKAQNLRSMIGFHRSG